MKTTQLSHGPIEYIREDGLTIWLRDDRPDMIWLPDGTTFPLTDEDKQLVGIDAVTQMIDDFHQGGKFYRCTTCKVKLPKEEIAGRPLFAGCVCKACWEKHQEHLTFQRKAGQVCRFCRKPYDDCCC